MFLNGPHPDCPVTSSKNGATLPLSHRQVPCSKSSPKRSLRTRKRSAEINYVPLTSTRRFLLETIVAKELQQSAVTIPTSSGYSLGTAEDVITVSVGTPAVTRVMSIDTGSDVSWVQCAPCAAQSCSSQKDNKLFDPDKSATYSAFSCGSAQCAQSASRATAA